MFVSEDPISSAIAELAKQGIAFTIDIKANGKETFLIDCVALSQDE